MSAPAFHRDFLVTCLGAYDDSGLGTGGFVAVVNGEALVLDKIDSTGLSAHGDTVYRFARGLRALAGYRADGFRSLLKMPEARDIHDVVVRDNLFRLRLDRHERNPLDRSVRPDRAPLARGRRTRRMASQLFLRIRGPVAHLGVWPLRRASRLGRAMHRPGLHPRF